MNQTQPDGSSATARDHFAALAAARVITRIGWLLSLLLLLLLLPATALAQDFTYTINGGAVTITGYTGSGGAVVIPDTIAGLPVKVICPLAFNAKSSLTSVTMPDTLVTMGWGAFINCLALASVKLGNGVTNVGEGAFSRCTALTSMSIGGSVTRIEDFAFDGCTSLTNVTIPNSVTRIGKSAFGFCSSLTAVTIPDKVTVLENGTFGACTSLALVTLLGRVTHMGETVFSQCNSLTSFAIPDGVSSIGAGAFLSCSGLASVTIPDSVTAIGTQAFGSCFSLTNVYFGGNAPFLGGASVFPGADNVIIYYLPGTSGWGGTFASRPTVLWNPTPQVTEPANPFGFTITGSENLVIVVEAATSLANPDWTPVSTNTLTGGSSPFNDPQWVNHPARYYRLRSP